MNKWEKEQVKKIDNCLHQTNLIIRTLKSFCRYELDSSIQIESITLQLDNIRKNNDKIQRAVNNLMQVSSLPEADSVLATET